MVFRTAHELSKVGPPGPHLWLALTHDGTRAAIERIDPNVEDAVWILDAERGTSRRLTTEIGAWTGVWASDGRRVVYAAAADGRRRSMSND